MSNRYCRLLVLAAISAALVACAAGVPREWEPLLEDLRVYQRRLGFERLDSFLEFSADGEGHLFCGQVSRLYLPYSYEDPALQWLDVKSEAECREGVTETTDVYFGRVEAMGEVGAAVTNEVLGVPLHRFVYLVLHEDCHDEFTLPYGFEEALCNLVAYRGMVGFSESKYRSISLESLTIRRYAATESAQTRAVKAIYEELAARYELYARGQLSAEGLLKERARILRRAERELRWKRGSLNNVGLANEMTYSRHYPLIEDAHAALGSNLARTMAFFKRVDAALPPAQAIMKRHKIRSQQSVEFLRAYEAEVVKLTAKLLAAETQTP